MITTLLRPRQSTSKDWQNTYAINFVVTTIRSWFSIPTFLSTLNVIRTHTHMLSGREPLVTYTHTHIYMHMHTIPYYAIESVKRYFLSDIYMLLSFLGDW